MEDWPQWRDKIIEMGKAESSTRPNIKKILGSLKDSENSDKEGMLKKPCIVCSMAGLSSFIIYIPYIEHQDACSLELLCKLLYSRPRDFGMLYLSKIMR